MKTTVKYIFIILAAYHLAGCNESGSDYGQSSDSGGELMYKSLVVGVPASIEGWDKFESISTTPAEVVVEFDEEKMMTTITLVSGVGRLTRNQ